MTERHRHRPDKKADKKASKAAGKGTSVRRDVQGQRLVGRPAR